jgi:chromate transporter
MTASEIESADRLYLDQNSVKSKGGLWPFTAYFLKLGTIGFGGPVALVGFMHRDLVEHRRWITEDTYKLSLTLAQIMPGPLAAQVAIAIGYFAGGILGATCTGLAFVLPSFLMVVATAAATGAITGAVVVLGARAFVDWPTAIIGLVSFGVLWRFKVPEPVLVALSGLVGLVLWPLVRMG